MIHRSKRQRADRSRIEIFVDKLEQLFNSMDPSPFHERDLDHDAEEFIVSWAQEYPRRDPLMLVVHVSQPASADFSGEMVEQAVQNYFAYRAKLKGMEVRRLFAQGRTSLLIGLLFLGICLAIREVLSLRNLGTLSAFARESLTIAGWVAMWRPMQIFLYDWWPLRRLGRVYEKLSRMPVELRWKKISKRQG